MKNEEKSGTPNLEGDKRPYHVFAEPLDGFTPLIQYRDATSFEWHILNGNLVRKFLDFTVDFPKTPTNFYSEE
jgi:hypothetical protein